MPAISQQISPTLLILLVLLLLLFLMPTGPIRC